MIVNFDSSAPDSTEHIETLINRFKRAKKIVVITGAGISVSSGIPDFRSSDGLYESAKNTKGKQGKHLFDAQILGSEESKEEFFKFSSKMMKMAESLKPSVAHNFIEFLAAQGKLLRLYTQNIDCIERNLCTVMAKNCLVQLHGSLKEARCMKCQYQCEILLEHVNLFEKGEGPSCPKCSEFNEKRIKQGKRSVRIGILRPDIVLYNEHHPKGDQIAKFIQADMRKKPDIVLIIGTSLRVHGLKNMVKQFSSLLHEKEEGTVIFMNKTSVSLGEWEDVIDFQCIGEADTIASVFQKSLKKNEKNQMSIKKFLKVTKNDKENNKKNDNESE